MEKGRDSRVIAIIALCVAIVGLSIGFAAFTKDLNITFSESNVKVSGDLDIKFLRTANPTDMSTTINGGGSNFISGVEVIDEQILVNPATISANGTTISGLSATFNNKDQVVYYKFHIYNNSEYDVYLKSINFLNYNNTGENKVCTAIEGTTQNLVDAACEDIHTVFVTDLDGDDSFYNEFFNGDFWFDDGTNDFHQLKISKNEMLFGQIMIVYLGDVLGTIYGNYNGALLPNGDFKINFGDIKFNFSSLEG